MWAIQIASRGNVKPDITLLMNGHKLMGDGITVGQKWTTNQFLALKFDTELEARQAIVLEFSAWEVKEFTIQATKLAPFCPGCSGAGLLTDDPQVLKCTRCGGIFTADRHEPITFEQAMKFVALNLNMQPNAGTEGQFMFDLDISTDWRGQATVGRVHGWADAKTKRVVQFG